MSYVITAQHHMYAPVRDVTRIIQTRWDSEPTIYDTSAEADAALTALEAQVYYTRHGETGRPTYSIRAVGSLPAYLGVYL